jgi:SAM-dependent methyltransferase
MGSAVAWLDRRFYPMFQCNWDDTIFRERILRLMKSEHAVLDLGAGAGIVEAMNFKGKARQVCGVDLDPRVVDNPFLDEGRVADAGKIPYDDNSFDFVLSDNVFEHLDQPAEVFAEIARVLKPGGRVLFKTPNKSHYMPLIARLTPHRFHQFINRLRGRHGEDTFPTRYKANSGKDIARLAEGAGLRVVRLERIEGRPEYLRMMWPTYLVGIVYERLVNSAEVFSTFRILLIGELQNLE